MFSHFLEVKGDTRAFFSAFCSASAAYHPCQGTNLPGLWAPDLKVENPPEDTADRGRTVQGKAERLRVTKDSAAIGTAGRRRCLLC